MVTFPSARSDPPRLQPVPRHSTNLNKPDAANVKENITSRCFEATFFYFYSHFTLLYFIYYLYSYLFIINYLVLLRDLERVLILQTRSRVAVVRALSTFTLQNFRFSSLRQFADLIDDVHARIILHNYDILVARIEYNIRYWERTRQPLFRQPTLQIIGKLRVLSPGNIVFNDLQKSGKKNKQLIILLIAQVSPFKSNIVQRYNELVKIP